MKCPLSAFALLCAASLAAQNTPTPPQPGQLAQPGARQTGGWLPNTVADAPFNTREKFRHRVIENFGIRSFAGAALAAAITLAADSPTEWGQDGPGYAQRYGSSFASSFARGTFEFGLETVLHEDPRYFPSTERGTKARLANVVKQIFICRTDSGGSSIAYARIASSFGAGFLTNTWQPKSNNSPTDAIERGFIGLGVDGGFNAAQEFIAYFRSKRRKHQP